MKIVSGDAELVLAPEMGGAVVSWTIDGRPIMRPANPNAASARDHACYPLVPFSNRVASRSFTFEEQLYELPDLMAGWAIHGAGWQCAWTPQGNTLVLDYPGGVLWPFAFHAEQEFELTPTSLAVTMRITNNRNGRAPAALGLHPFFVRNAETRLQVNAGSVWLSDKNMIPYANTPVPPEWDYSTEREIGEPRLDNCFAAWDREAILTWPERGERLVIRATEPMHHLIIYVPPGLPFTAIEPVSNMNDGLNHMNTTDDHGMTILEPGGTLAARITMLVEPLA